MTSVSTGNSVREVLRQGIARLRQTDVPSFTLAAELLLLHVTGRERAWIYSHPEEILPSAEIAAFFALVDRRSEGEPTQHLTGKQEFWGLECQVTPDVLIPRPETEHVVEVALDRLAVRELRAGRSPKLSGDGVTIVDIGTGSGCIALALAKELPSAIIYASDISSAALHVARRNAERLGLAARIRFLESHLFDAFLPLKFDLIVSNPPYVGRREANSLAREVRDHEPESALYGGEEGYEVYGALVAQAQSFLKPGGLLVLELGHDSLTAVQPLLKTPAWANIGIAQDLAGIPRVLSAERL
jgi:release factor glutamine methyltransferase